MRLLFSAEKTVQGPTQANIIDVTVTPTTRNITAGQEVDTVQGDINVKATAGASGTLTDYTITSSKDIRIGELDTDHAELDGNKVVELGTATSNTTAKVTVRAGISDTPRYVSLGYNTDVEWSYDTISYVDGTLGKHCHDQVTGLLDGKTAGTATQRYIASSNNDVDNPSVTINGSFFLPEIDLSGVSVIGSTEATNGSGDDRYAWALVSPRHALVASHVNWEVGHKAAFRKADGSGYVTAEILGIKQVPDMDLEVLYLDTAVEGCKIYKILPQGWERTLIPSVHHARTSEYSSILPIIRKARHSTDDTTGSFVLINTVFGENPIQSVQGYPVVSHPQGSTLTYGASHYTGVHPDYTRNATFPSGAIGDPWEAEEVLSGDSSSPAFVVINGELVLLLTVFSTWESVNISYFTDVINEYMNELAHRDDKAKGQYQLTHPDLSGFPTF